ncbi:hypothetical protein ISS08_02400 [Candidatus Pacearchaeota archaeon]|nr:hypothetical protein [Candidatus Pacearchaeota archaeon]
MKILSNIFGKKEKTRKRINLNEARDFFSGLGIDMDTIGFHSMANTKKTHPLEAYHAHFENLNANLKINSEDKAYILISGIYNAQAVASYQDKSFDWHPGTPATYVFQIKDGELTQKLI